MELLFTPEDTWLNGYYELLIDFGSHSDERMDAALKSLWDHPTLAGCYRKQDVEPALQRRIVPHWTGNWKQSKLYGIATVPNGKRTACGTLVMTFDKNRDELLFYIPLGALATVYDIGGFPFDFGSGARLWEEPLTEWLADIGKHVYSSVAYRFAVVGLEGLTTGHREKLLDHDIPDTRSVGFLLQETDGLAWYPINDWPEKAL